MKRKILLICILAIFTTTSILFISCNKKTNLEKLHDYISSYQTSLYQGNDENLNIDITEINQEETFIADGLKGNMKNYVRITIKPKEITYLDYQYTYKINASCGSISGTMQKDALGITFSDNLENLHEIGDLETVEITYNSNTTKYDLINILKDNIEYNKALEIAYNNFKDKIDPILDNKDFDREIYIKLITNKSGANNEHYWYVSFIKARDDYYSTLISLDGQIVTSKIMSKL